MKRAKSAVKLVVLDNSDPISAETLAVHKRIRQRAFELSEERAPDAQERFDWITSESEIISVPLVELVEKNGKYELTFAVPGVHPDDVNVLVTSDQILLKSERRHQHDLEFGTVHLCDFKSSTVFRSVDLPQPIDVNSVKIDFVEG